MQCTSVRAEHVAANKVGIKISAKSSHYAIMLQPRGEKLHHVITCTKADK